MIKSVFPLDPQQQYRAGQDGERSERLIAGGRGIGVQTENLKKVCP